MTSNKKPESRQKIGDESLNRSAMQTIVKTKKVDEPIIAISGFNFQNAVIAITDQRVLIADENSLEFNEEITSLKASRDGRTLILRKNWDPAAAYQMGKDEWVETLVSLINHQKSRLQRGQDYLPKSAAETPRPTRTETRPEPHSLEEFQDRQNPGIAERVQFWQEQDQINQELIPRLIRQSELLTQHIGEHENLPLVAAQAISEALKDAREEVNAILQEAKADREEQAALLNAVTAERDQQAAHYQAEREELRAQHEVHTEEQAKLLEQTKGEREEQSKQHETEMTRLNKKANLMRNYAIGSAGVATLTALTAILLAILT